jgi:hypothetical protein
MKNAVKAAVAYFVIVFAIGFVLGTVRVLLVIPRVGPSAAVLIEAPILLSASWLVCGWLLHSLRVPPAWSARSAMGGTAFALLMAAELSLSVFVFGKSAAEHVQAYLAPHQLIGLAAQLAFAAFPLFRRREKPDPFGGLQR